MNLVIHFVVAVRVGRRSVVIAIVVVVVTIVVAVVVGLGDVGLEPVVGNEARRFESRHTLRRLRDRDLDPMF
jgi:hypothetical protein